MTMTLARLSALTLGLLFCLEFSPANAAEPTGTWLTQNSDARIRVARCGAAMCGTIVWIKDPVDAQTGQPPVDSKNPDPAKRNRKIVGLQIFAMPSDGNGGWAGGIYNSDDGQTYKGKLVLRSTEQLEVHGCAGIFCGSETWTKFGR
jgi:uncharacterized protein (DUF2147 family)